MNRGKKIKQMRRFINKYGVISAECKRPPDKNFPPYRKGSYQAHFDSEQFGLSYSVGHINKYEVYKCIVAEIKDRIKENAT